MALELQLNILEDLDLIDLVNIAQTNKIFHILAMDIYRRKYQDKTIELEGRSELFNEIYSNENSISFSNPSMATQFLHSFGHLIMEISIFGRQINAEIINNIARNINSVQKLDEILPNLRRLNLIYVTISDAFGFLNYTFPHLEHLMLKFSNMGGFTEDDASIVLQNNPQIRSLSVHKTTPEFLKTINTHLSNLESLEILQIGSIFPNHNNDPIDFRNVKKLSVVAGQACLIQHVSFSQLEEFTLKCFYFMDNTWILGERHD